MTTWTSEELSKVGIVEELEIASLRRDGTLRKPVTIWVVRHGDELYVRSAYGHTSSWFRGTQDRHEGHIPRAASTRTFSSSKPTTMSVTRSTPPTARSTGATAPASSLPW